MKIVKIDIYNFILDKLDKILSFKSNAGNLKKRFIVMNLIEKLKTCIDSKIKIKCNNINTLLIM